MSPADDRQLRQRIRRVESLLQEVDRFKDPEARACIKEIVQALMDLHGMALEGILERVAALGEAGLAVIGDLGRDELISSVLLLYGLHPLDVDTRVRQALDKVRPYLHSHGGDVELLGIQDGVVRLRLDGSCHGCPASAMTLKQAIEEAVYERAPEVTAVQADGVAEAPHHPPSAKELVAFSHDRNGRPCVPLPVVAQ
jgi:Fe-S cluster biogenesis protein NfuA